MKSLNANIVNSSRISCPSAFPFTFTLSRFIFSINTVGRKNSKIIIYSTGIHILCSIDRREAVGSQNTQSGYFFISSELFFWTHGIAIIGKKNPNNNKQRLTHGLVVVIDGAFQNIRLLSVVHHQCLFLRLLILFL